MHCRKAARGTSYYIELEFVMKVEDAFHCTESVYIYYVPLKMRKHIRTYLKQRIPKKRKCMLRYISYFAARIVLQSHAAARDH